VEKKLFENKKLFCSCVSYLNIFEYQNINIFNNLYLLSALAFGYFANSKKKKAHIKIILIKRLINQF
jgi:hypothetical protein